MCVCGYICTEPILHILWYMGIHSHSFWVRIYALCASFLYLCSSYVYVCELLCAVFWVSAFVYDAYGLIVLLVLFVYMLIFYFGALICYLCMDGHYCDTWVIAGDMLELHAPW